MSKTDDIIRNHFSRMGKRGVEKHPELHNKERMTELSRKAIKARERNRQMRALVVDLDTPENNCKICGASHKEINDNNKATYAEVHQKYLVKLEKKP